MRKDIKYSLEKLNNKQSLFQVDTDLTDQKKPSDEVSVASSMMDRLQDGLVNMLKKKNPDLKVPINNIITKQRRKTTVLQEKSWMREYSSINMELIHNKSIISRQTSKSKLDSDYVSMSTTPKTEGVSLSQI